MIEVRDSGLVRRGQIHTYDEAEFVLRFNRAGAWRITLPADQDAATELIERGSGIVATRDGVRVMSGFTTKWRRERTESDSVLIVSGLDDTAWLDARLAVPVPAGPPYTSQAYDVRTGVAETVMRQYVDFNAAASAVAARRVAGLVLAADGARGSTVTGRARFHRLSELLSELALSGGDLGFRVVQSGLTLVFEVYAPTDRTTTAKFSLELGNLAGYTYEEQAPDANFIYVAGGGEETARTFVEGGDSASIVDYGRIEAFRDRRDTTDVAELAQQRDTELSEQAQRFGLSLIPIDTKALAYGVDYALGDQVTVEVDGTPIRDVLREVRFLLKGGEPEDLTPTVGTPGLGEPDRTLGVLDRVRRIGSRLSLLERR